MVAQDRQLFVRILLFQLRRHVVGEGQQLVGIVAEPGAVAAFTPVLFPAVVGADGVVGQVGTLVKNLDELFGHLFGELLVGVAVLPIGIRGTVGIPPAVYKGEPFRMARIIGFPGYELGDVMPHVLLIPAHVPSL